MVDVVRVRKLDLSPSIPPLRWIRPRYKYGRDRISFVGPSFPTAV